MVETTVQDLRYAGRWFARAPGFTSLAVLSLAVAIGFNAALFGLVDAMVLRPLPGTNTGDLVAVYTSGSDGDPYATSSYLDYLDLESGNEVFTDVAGHSLMFAPLNLPEGSRLVIGEIVTANFFDVFGIPAALGRTFTADDDRIDAERVVVLSHRHWQREYAGDPSALGRTLRLRGKTYTIVGVAPDWFNGTMPALSAELWVPASAANDVEPGGIIDAVPSPTGTGRLDRRGQRWMLLKGRLKRGVGLEQARANIEVIGQRLQAAHAQTNKDRRMSVLPASRGRLIHPSADQMVLTIGVGLMTLLGLVLLIACFNVAGMLLARAAARRREIGLRLAIGATRGRIVRQLLTESVLLAGLGAVAGLALAWLLVRTLGTVPLPFPVPVTLNVPFDLRIVLFTMLISSVAGIVAGLAPALRAGRTELVRDIRGDLRGERRWSLRDGLVMGQMAVTVVLLVVAGLLGRSLLASSHAALGFGSQGLALVSTDPGMAGYDDGRAKQFFEQAVDRIRALPGVEAAAVASRLPFSLNFTENQYDIPDHTSPSDRGFTIFNVTVSADYFRTLGVPLLEGRGFTTVDTPESPRVAIISESMARRFWPGRSAVGQRFRRTGRDVWIEVVGVSSDYRVRTVGEEPQAYIHLPATQSTDAGPILVARTRGDAAQLVAAMRRELMTLEPNLVLLENQTMETQVAATLLPMRASLTVAGAGGLVALGLAAVGLYGVIAFSVARRTREIGIRMALGAERSRVVSLVLRQGLTLAGGALLIGGLLAAIGTRALAGLLYGVSLADPLAWTGAVVTMVLVSLLANCVPAYRAARVEPSIALRTE